jgi:hypothetical protein
MFLRQRATGGCLAARIVNDDVQRHEALLLVLVGARGPVFVDLLNKVEALAARYGELVVLLGLECVLAVQSPKALRGLATAIARSAAGATEPQLGSALTLALAASELSDSPYFCLSCALNDSMPPTGWR